VDDKAIRGVPWTFLGLGVTKLISTLTMIVLARLVAPSEFGLMAIGTIAINFLYWFGGNSFGAALVVHQDLDRREQGTVLSLSLLGAAGAAVLCVALAPLAADALHQPRLTGVMAALSIAVLMSGFVSFYELLLQRELEFRRRFVALALQTLSFTVVSIALAAAGAGVWSLVAGQIAAMAVFAVALGALAPYRVAPHFERSVVDRVLGTGLGFFSQGITQFIRQNTDTVLVGRAFNTAAVGYYAMAFRLGDLTYSALTDPLARVTFPAFARSHARDEDVRPAFLTALRLVALVAVPVGVVLSAAAEPFTRLLFGADWLPMVPVLGVVGVWAAIRPVEATLSWLLNSLGRAGSVGRVAVFVLIPLFAGLVLALSSGRLALVACVPLADTLISLAMLTYFVRRHAGLGVSDLWAALRVVALCAVADWAITRVLANGLESQPAVVALALSVAGGVAVFGAGVALLDRALLRSAVTQGARMLGRSRAPQTAI
jgi:lipopolysaccharide exporter